MSPNIPQSCHSLQIRYGAVWTPVRGNSAEPNRVFEEVHLQTGEYIQSVEVYGGNLFDLLIPYSQKGMCLFE